MRNIKIKRIEAEMVRTISEILNEEARDSIIKNVTITGASVANDLSYAKIYFTSLSNMEHKALEKEMNEAASYLRLMLAEKMDLRNTPKLKFLYDDSVAYGEKIERILKEISEEE